MSRPPSPRPLTLAGLILAGGASSRMGRDKALLELGGVTLLDRTRALLKSAGAERVLIAGRPDLPGGLPDASPGAGPARAAADALLALADAGAEMALVMPVDMPLMTVETLHVLIAAAAGGAAAYEGHPLPFCARLRGAPLETAAPRSMHDLLGTLSALWFPTEGMDPRIFANVNTPEEWERIAKGPGGA